MTKKWVRLQATLLISSLVLGSASCSSTAPRQDIKLVVVIVVDQFRYDFLERFKSSLGSGGFRRLIEDGA